MALSPQEEEGEDGDVSSGPPGASHKLPSAPAWHHFPPRYADMSCVGLRDAHEENPESILDEHVQRVMRTPGCQSPGPGHRSPDSAHMPKMGVLGGTVPGHGKHVPKSGAKLDTVGLHLHRHGHHMATMAQLGPRSQLRPRPPAGSRAASHGAQSCTATRPSPEATWRAWAPPPPPVTAWPTGECLRRFPLSASVSVRLCVSPGERGQGERPYLLWPLFSLQARIPL